MYRSCSCSDSNFDSKNSSNNYELNCNINNNIFENVSESSCSCGFNNSSVFPGNWMYGHNYVPHQKLTQVYAPEMGLKMGTIFPELVSPYCPNQSMEEINYLKNSNSIGGGCNS